MRIERKNLKENVQSLFGFIDLLPIQATLSDFSLRGYHGRHSRLDLWLDLFEEVQQSGLRPMTPAFPPATIFPSQKARYPMHRPIGIVRVSQDVEQI